MRRGRITGTIAVVALGVLIAATAASAASPREIYRDWAADGRIDGNYSQRDLESALSDTTIQGYGSGNFAPAVKQRLRNQGGTSPLGSPRRSGTLPFTGLDLALLVGGAAFLLVLGGGLRRLGRSRAA
jgi:hypothetical protein